MEKKMKKNNNFFWLFEINVGLKKSLKKAKKVI